MEDDKTTVPLQTYVVPPSSIVPQPHVPLVVSNVSGAVIGKFVSGINGVPGASQTVAVIPASGTPQLPIFDGSATAGICFCF